MSRWDASTTPSPTDEISYCFGSDVVSLRRWGTPDEAFNLVGHESISIGASKKCRIQLHDDSGQTSRMHAALSPSGSAWELSDLKSSNGTTVDGEPITRRILQGGAKIQIGKVVLVAETQGFQTLRMLVSRLIGFSPDMLSKVDEALQSLRAFVNRRTPLFLLGSEDLPPIAARLHEEMMGPSVTFVVHHDRGIKNTVDSVGEGTICVSNFRRDGERFMQAIQGRVNSPRFIFCRKTEIDFVPVSIHSGLVGAIAIPLLSSRRSEMKEIISSTVEDLLRSSGLQEHKFTEYDQRHLSELEFKNLLELEDTLNRLILYRNLGPSGAASRICRTASAVSQWHDKWMRPQKL